MRVVTGLALIIFGSLLLYWCYFDPFARQALNPAQLEAMRFWTVVGWVIVPVGIALIVWRKRLT